MTAPAGVAPTGLGYYFRAFGRLQGLENLHISRRNPLGALRQIPVPCEMGSHGLLEYVDGIAVASDV